MTGGFCTRHHTDPLIPDKIRVVTSSAAAAMLNDIPRSADLRLAERGGMTWVTVGSVMLACYRSGDAGLRNVAVVMARQQRPPCLPGALGRGIDFGVTHGQARACGPDRSVRPECTGSPAGVVPGHLRHQRPHGRCGPWPPGRTARIGPVPPDEVSMPALQCLRGNDQAQLAASRRVGRRRDRAGAGTPMTMMLCGLAAVVAGHRVCRLLVPHTPRPCRNEGEEGSITFPSRNAKILARPAAARTQT